MYIKTKQPETFIPTKPATFIQAETHRYTQTKPEPYIHRETNTCIQTETGTCIQKEILNYAFRIKYKHSYIKYTHRYTVDTNYRFYYNIYVSERQMHNFFLFFFILLSLFPHNFC